ncbi:MAG: hypothetical protein M5U34_21730 [Chloroflexi bacterium]|nr:hypothetical protein [Chloroflexota bacterium]
MVHALEKIHTLLKPDGFLIDIHPTPEPPPIEVRLGAESHRVGWVREVDDYCEYVAADEALATAVSRKLYTWQKQGTFAFTTYADTILDLRHHLAETWTDAIIDDDVIRRTQDLMQTPELDKEVVLREAIKIARLKPGDSVQ